MTKAKRQHGFTLVELMVALLLGLVVLGSVVNVFLANQQSYRSNQALGEVQDASRIAFELMARDIREMGMTGCGTASVINATNSTAWWSNWSEPLIGYDSATSDPELTAITGNGAPVADNSSIRVLSVAGTSASFAAQKALVGAAITLNESTAAFTAGQIVVVCTPETALIGQLSAATTSSITFAAEGAGTPGNSEAIAATFPINSLITPLNAVDWYIGVNPTGGRSLYRRALVAGVATSQEMVRHVVGLQILYHITGTTTSPYYVNATGVGTNWPTVGAVRITLTTEAPVDQGSSTPSIQREFTTTIALRGRVD